MKALKGTLKGHVSLFGIVFQSGFKNGLEAFGELLKDTGLMNAFKVP